MRLRRLAHFVLFLLALTGCAGTEHLIASDAAPDPKSGYVAGLFANNASNTGFAIVITEVSSGSEYKLSFGNEIAERRGRGAVINMIALPPGKYRIGKWATFGLELGNEYGRTDLAASSPAAVTFSVASGEVVFLGSFYAAAEYAPVDAFRQSVRWRLSNSRLSLASAQQLLQRHYPRFAEAAFSCAYCGL